MELIGAEFIGADGPPAYNPPIHQLNHRHSFKFNEFLSFSFEFIWLSLMRLLEEKEMKSNKSKEI